MKKKVKKYSASLKAKVVLSALREDKTIAQIGSEYQIHPANIKLWKRDFLRNVEIVFDRNQALKDYKKALEDSEKTKAQLYETIGELSSQLKWVKKKSREAGVESEAGFD